MGRLGGLAMINCPIVSQDVQFRGIGHAKLPLSIPRYRLNGLAMGNVWGHGDGVRERDTLSESQCRLDGPNGLLCTLGIL